MIRFTKKKRNKSFSSHNNVELFFNECNKKKAGEVFSENYY